MAPFWTKENVFLSVSFTMFFMLNFSLLNDRSMNHKCPLLEPDESSSEKSFPILNYGDLKYLRTPNNSVCEEFNDYSNDALSEENLLVILIFTAPEEVEIRDAIRKSWGLSNAIEKWRFVHLFILGIGQNEISDESDDVIQVEFEDNEGNKVLKHLLGYKWILQFCQGASFVLKINGNVFPNLYLVVYYLEESANHGTQIVCDFKSNVRPNRNESAKDYVSIKDFDRSFYPSYCAGDYFMSEDAISRIFWNHRKPRVLGSDDVFITGIVREFAHQYYTEDISNLVEYLKPGQNFSRVSKLFYVFDSKERFLSEAFRLLHLIHEDPINIRINHN